MAARSAAVVALHEQISLLRGGSGAEFEVHGHAAGGSLLVSQLSRTKGIAKRANGRRLEVEDVPLRTGAGTHVAYIHVGSPPQMLSVILDTGSGELKRSSCCRER
jgi:hypothetical protein